MLLVLSQLKHHDFFDNRMNTCTPQVQVVKKMKVAVMLLGVKRGTFLAFPLLSIDAEVDALHHYCQ